MTKSEECARDWLYERVYYTAWDDITVADLGALLAEAEARGAAAERARIGLSAAQCRNVAALIDRAVRNGPHPPLPEAAALGGITLREHFFRLAGAIESDAAPSPGGKGGGA